MNGFHIQVVCQVNREVNLNIDILISLLLYKPTLNLPSMIPLIFVACTHNNGIFRQLQRSDRLDWTHFKCATVQRIVVSLKVEIIHLWNLQTTLYKWCIRYFCNSYKRAHCLSKKNFLVYLGIPTDTFIEFNYCFVRALDQYTGHKFQ